VIRLFVPADSAALAVGADGVARALDTEAACRNTPVTIVRSGSRGMAWLEPLVEVETPEGRIAYGPVKASDVASLFDAGLAEGGAHPLRIGRPDDHPWLAGQTRLTFARCGVVDPVSPADYRAHGGFQGLARARAIGSAKTIETMTVSGLRGRGGAGFPAGLKWKTVAEAPGDVRYIVCNADEGDSGTFADRMILEGDPFSLIEGMAIAAHAVGAAKGFVYSRSEYPHANRVFQRALDAARADGELGALDIELRVGAGAYVCGEETSLLESLEGRRGQVRAKPPLPAHSGLFGKPTVVNNVLTLATAPWILAHGGEAYSSWGTGRSRGTQPIQLAGNIRRPGLYEAPFGLTLGQIVMEIGGGTASGRPLRAVQCGGPLGAYFPPALFDTVYDYEAFAAQDGLVGHGGVVVFDDTVDMAAQARFAFAFCAVESCGKCTPCRIGSVRGEETLQKIIDGVELDANLALVEDLCHTLKFGSLCALGGFTPYPVMSAIKHFPEDFRAPKRHRLPVSPAPANTSGRDARKLRDVAD
jgi:formate dehydrogenase iron-sulfur subunit